MELAKFILQKKLEKGAKLNSGMDKLATVMESIVITNTQTTNFTGSSHLYFNISVLCILILVNEILFDKFKVE